MEKTDVFMKQSPLLFYTFQMYVLDKNSLYSQWTYKNITKKSREEEGEISLLIESYFAQWYYTDAKMVEFQKKVMALLLPPEMIRLYLLIILWKDPTNRPALQLNANIW